MCEGSPAQWGCLYGLAPERVWTNVSSKAPGKAEKRVNRASMPQSRSRKKPLSSCGVGGIEVCGQQVDCWRNKADVRRTSEFSRRPRSDKTLSAHSGGES